MSRALFRPARLLKDFALPATPIDYLDGTDGGAINLAYATNTVAEQHRGSLVGDYDPAGLVVAASTPIYYAARCWHGSGGVTKVRVWVLGNKSSGSPTVQVSSADAGDSASGAGVTGWLDLGVLDIGDGGAEHDVLTVQWTGTAVYSIYAIAIFADRGQTSLPVAADGWSYPDGVVPLDHSHYTTQQPFCAGSLRLLHTNLDLVRRRGSQVLASAFRTAQSSITRYGRARVPVGLQPGETATLRWLVRQRWTGLAGVNLGNVAVTCGDVSASSPVSSGGSFGWVTLDTEIAIPTDGQQTPVYAPTRLVVSGYSEIDSISAWWRDLS